MHNLFWALLILFLAGAFLRMDWVYYLVYVVGGVWLYSHWSVRRGLSRLTTERRMLNRAFAGESIDVRVRLTNRSWLPLPWVVLQERVPLDLRDIADYRIALNVGRRATVEHSYRLQCKRRGYYALGPLSLTTGDLFGFAGGAWEETTPPYITVYPQVVPLQQLGLPSRIPFGVLSSSQRIYEDPARLSGVRAYASGDSERRIHWKASAHADKLLVKQFQPAIAINVMVVLDMSQESYPMRGLAGSSEWAISVAASIASAVTAQRQPVGLLCNGLDVMVGDAVTPLPARSGHGQLMTILEGLARVKLRTSAPPLGAWLSQALAGLDWGTTVVFVGAKLDDDTLWVLHSIYRRGSKVLALICADQQSVPELRARAGRLGITVHQTLWERDLQTL